MDSDSTSLSLSPNVPLAAVRHGKKTGLWPFRHATYTVYQEKEDGIFLEVVCGDFTCSDRAIKAARNVLKQERENRKPIVQFEGSSRSRGVLSLFRLRREGSSSRQHG